MAYRKALAFTLLLAVTLAARECSARREKAPPRKKPDYCKSTFSLAAAPTNESFLVFAGDGVPQKGSSFSFGLGLFRPSTNESMGNVYGSGVVMDLKGADPYAAPENYIIAFTNFNFASVLGQVAVQGVWIEKPAAVNSFPIVGGSGIYSGAAGTVDMKVVDRSTYLFKLKLPRDSC